MFALLKCGMSMRYYCAFLSIFAEVARARALGARKGECLVFPFERLHGSAVLNFKYCVYSVQRSCVTRLTIRETTLLLVYGSLLCICKGSRVTHVARNDVGIVFVGGERGAGNPISAIPSAGRRDQSAAEPRLGRPTPFADPMRIMNAFDIEQRTAKTMEPLARSSSSFLFDSLFSLASLGTPARLETANAHRGDPDKAAVRRSRRRSNRVRSATKKS